MKKKQLAAAALIAAMVTTGAAATLTNAETPQNDENTSVMLFDDASPYYTNLENIVSSLIIEDGTAYCGSSFLQRTTKRAVMKTNLQRKKAANKTWSSVQFWTDEYSTTGPHLVEHSYKTVAGYQYRNLVTVTFYSGSTVVEEVSMDSPVKNT